MSLVTFQLSLSEMGLSHIHCISSSFALLAIFIYYCYYFVLCLRTENVQDRLLFFFLFRCCSDILCVYLDVFQLMNRSSIIVTHLAISSIYVRYFVFPLTFDMQSLATKQQQQKKNLIATTRTTTTKSIHSNKISRRRRKKHTRRYHLHHRLHFH